VSLVTQYDVDLVKRIEQKVGVELKLLPGIEEEEALLRLGRVATARRGECCAEGEWRGERRVPVPFFPPLRNMHPVVHPSPFWCLQWRIFEWQTKGLMTCSRRRSGGRNALEHARECLLRLLGGVGLVLLLQPFLLLLPTQTEGRGRGMGRGRRRRRGMGGTEGRGKRKGRARGMRRRLREERAPQKYGSFTGGVPEKCGICVTSGSPLLLTPPPTLPPLPPSYTTSARRSSTLPAQALAKG
jgi:hypothetical protein